MEAAQVYLDQLKQFEQELDHALGNVLPLVAESAIGKVALAKLLINAAADLLEEAAGAAFTSDVLDSLMRSRLDRGSSSSDRSRPHR
ncbi:MAG: hypothetical protein E6Q43_07310 [Dokdonella sp.]|nr:MAG: hypothetical protein E6Q43_07310 [Dokdonella sp.]